MPSNRTTYISLPTAPGVWRDGAEGGCVFCSERRKIAVEIRFGRLCTRPEPDERVSSARTRFPYKVRWVVGEGRPRALERATLDDDESVAPRGYTVIVTRVRRRVYRAVLPRG